MLLALAKKQLVAATAAASSNPDLPIGSLTGQPALYATPRYGDVDGHPVYIQGEGNMAGFSPVTLCTEIETGETAWISTGAVLGRRLEPFTPTARSRGKAITGKAANTTAAAK
jgi:hypothetical protein